MIQEQGKHFAGKLNVLSDFNSQWAGLLDSRNVTGLRHEVCYNVHHNYLVNYDVN